MTELDVVVAELREAALYHAVHTPSVHTPAKSLPSAHGRAKKPKKPKYVTAPTAFRPWKAAKAR